jgi:threonine dehydrogenase-like Zn-dependent dehydrogenase
LHAIVMLRQVHHGPTRAYTSRRIAQGKSQREVRRCLKRTVARQLYRLLEHRHQSPYQLTHNGSISRAAPRPALVTIKEPIMRGAILYAPGDVRVEERDDPKITEPTDATIRLSATCVCGSDLWPYRGIEAVNGPSPMGHEYVGIVQEVGSQVTTIKPGQFVVGSFFASDNTCETCQAGYQSSCLNKEAIGANGAQAESLRVPLADGTLVATPDLPADDLVAGLLAAPDVLGTGWFGAVAAEAGPPKTVAVVGDGAVGLLAVLAASQLGAERIIAMSRHQPRQKLAVEFGATDIVTERGDAGVARVKELTGGLAPTAWSRRSAPRSRCCRPSVPPGPAGTSATSASPTAWSCPAPSCSSPTCTCTAAPPRCAASCPSSST